MPETMTPSARRRIRRDARIVELYGSGLSMAKVAARLGISVGTVHSVVSRSQGALRALDHAPALQASPARAPERWSEPEAPSRPQQGGLIDGEVVEPGQPW